ncbi:MAG: hypothetical protein K8Q89_05170 [Nitrosarchaeum sp.]|nr:hypothetical protein [Nitrosarchaeum sp.]
MGKFVSTCDKIVHAPFKKIMKYDLFWLVIGAIIWIGLEVFVFRKITVVI